MLALWNGHETNCDFDHFNSKIARYTNQHQYDEESFPP